MRLTAFAVLLVTGAAWGAAVPLTKIAVSGGYRHFGLLFWQTALGAAALALVLVVLRKRVPLHRSALWTYLVIALIGSVIPAIASYNAAVHLPAGVMAILLSTIPMIAFPIALGLRLEPFRWRRLAGLSLGLAGVLVMVLPEASLPEAGQVWWVPIALIAAACYAFEGNYVSRWGTAGLDPMQVLCGASIVGVLISLPLALVSGQFIDPRGSWGAPDTAIVLGSLLHVAAYTAYVWLVGRAGAVFTVQVSYFVTLFGVFWAMVLLSESYANWIWLALALMLCGVALVQPGLAGRARLRETEAR